MAKAVKTDGSALDFPADFYDNTNVPPRRDELVSLTAYRQVMQRVDGGLTGVKGDFVPIVGARGIGKTCCLQFIMRQLAERGIACILMADDDVDSVTRPVASDDETFAANYLTGLVKVLKEYMEMKEGSTDAFKLAMEKRRMNGNPVSAVLLLDNIDRLFPKDDPTPKGMERRGQRVREFFGRHDARFKQIKEDFLIIIAGDPEWAHVLLERDFNYLKYGNRVELSGISEADLERILDARLKYVPETDNPKVENYWKKDFLSCVLVETNGVTRDALLMLQSFNSELTKLPFRARDYEAKRREQLYTACRARLAQVIEGNFAPLSLARDLRNRISHGVELLRRTWYASSRGNQLDKVAVLELLNPILQAYENRRVIMDERLQEAWKAGVGVTVRAKRKKVTRPELHPDVREALANWQKSTNLDAGLLLRAYFDKPFTQWYVDIRDDLDCLRQRAKMDETDTQDLDRLEMLYSDLALEHGSYTPHELVEDSCDMVCLMASWLGNFCGSPDRLSQNLPLNKAREVLREVFRLAQLQFPYEADLQYIQTVFQHTKESGSGLDALDAQQVRDVYTKAARVVAGTLRQLPPEKLAFRLYSPIGPSKTFA